MKTENNKKKMKPNIIREINYKIKKLQMQKNPDGATVFQPILKQYYKIKELQEKKKQLLN